VGAAGRLSVEWDDAALALVYEISRGVPQRVNLVCDRALVRGFEASLTLIDERLVASAARDLGFLAPEPIAKKIMKRLLATVALVGLMVAGAAAGVFVFRAPLTRALAAWTAPPPPPPVPAIGIGAPVETQPPPGEAPPDAPGAR
jgi:general secretion pathway protein A